MAKFLVFGHQNPDTDAIASSYGWAYLEREAWGRDAEAVALGTPNEESAFALDYFGVTAPRVVTSAVAEGVATCVLALLGQQIQQIMLDHEIKELTGFR